MLAAGMRRGLRAAVPKAAAQRRFGTKKTILDIQKKYADGDKLTMVTCYDYPTATAVERTGVDMILVGDTCGVLVHGHKDTLPVTMDEIVMHTRAVRRGAPDAFIIADMPFGSFEVSKNDAVANAVRCLKEGGADAVKLEGGVRMRNTAHFITQAGVMVMGHIGLTPLTAAAMGGVSPVSGQPKTATDAEEILDDARALQESGCFAVLIEGVPEVVAEYVSKSITIPTLGIGAGKRTSGQAMLLHDMIGMNPAGTPKFCKQYANVLGTVENALTQYVSEVQRGAFPSAEHCYKMPKEEAEAVRRLLFGADDDDCTEDGSNASSPSTGGGVSMPSYAVESELASAADTTAENSTSPDPNASSA